MLNELLKNINNKLNKKAKDFYSFQIENDSILSKTNNYRDKISLTIKIKNLSNSDVKVIVYYFDKVEEFEIYQEDNILEFHYFFIGAILNEFCYKYKTAQKHIENFENLAKNKNIKK